MKLATTCSYAVTLLVGPATASLIGSESFFVKNNLLTAPDFGMLRLELASCLRGACQPASGITLFGTWAISQVNRIKSEADLNQALKECRGGCIRGIVSDVEMLGTKKKCGNNRG
ncbi:hypothetical protein RJ55_02511 [Drechmeria coniospora]|nr:hypothetical protein RJ55_02511 [Drechmeria coniospora]